MNEIPPPPVEATEAVDSAAPPERSSSLSVLWRWVLAAGWGVVMAALGGIAQAGFIADDGPFWLQIKPVPFAFPTLALLALASNWRRTLLVSYLAVAVTGAIAIGDLVTGHRLVGASELACAVSALVVTLAATLGRTTVERTGPAGAPA